MRLLQPFL
jgi:Nuclease-related domain